MKKGTIRLPERLRAISELIPEGAFVADIGTDHGILPVYLAQSGRTRHIIASDIGAGPLSSARRTAEKHGVGDMIRFVAAPGLEGVGETEADTIVISGMGGETIAGILMGAPWTKHRGVRLILQPQTKIGVLYDFLRENGYHIINAGPARDRGRRYTIILAEGRREKSKGDLKMPTVKEVNEFIFSIAPLEMKADFDNVGFLVGQGNSDASRIMVCLDITNDVISEALEIGAELIVSHHPMFLSLKSVTDTDTTGGKILRMITGGISAICMHTNLDAAKGGINDVLAVAVGISRDGAEAELLSDDKQLPSGEPFSYGRVGCLKHPLPLPEYLEMLKTNLKTDGLRYYDAGREVFKVGIVSGSGGDEFHHAKKHACDTFVTADIKYSVFLEAKELGINLIDAGHFSTENVISDVLAQKLRTAFPTTEVKVSKKQNQTVRFF
jgi:dinuclear metal center YbgI/SA1388 family protein